MDRRKFLQLIPVGVTVAVIAPKLLIPKEPVKLLPLQVYESRSYGLIAIKARRKGMNWVNGFSTARLRDYDITGPKKELLNYMSK